MRLAIHVGPSHVDPLLVGATLGLAVIGMIMVGSASISFADRETGEPLYFLVRHLGAVSIGVIALLFAFAVPSQVWFRLHWLLLLIGLGLLVLVLLPSFGMTVNGSTRWLALGPIRFQASEPARLSLLLYLAAYAVRHQRDLAGSFSGFVKPMLVIVAASALLLAEPDFGSVVVLTVASLALLFIAGARLREIVFAVIAAVLALVALAFASPYRVERLTAYLDPFADPYASGFQLVQSLIAIGRGDWLGVGLGGSVQKLFYLPEAHTDFVFAVLSEELGFVGSTLVIVLFACIVYRAIAMGQRALRMNLPFQGFASSGVGLMLGIEAFINIGVNTGLLPTKGLTLPLVSYGRSSTVVTLFALGVLMRIHHEISAAAQTQSAEGAPP
jgi:cell division protein FtsW